MRVIDFRARPNTPEYMAMYPSDYETFTRVPGHEHPGSRSLDEFVAALDDHGVDVAVFTGRQYFDADGNMTKGVENDYIADCVARHPDRLVGFAGLDVTGDVMEATAELERAVEDLGLSGTSVDTHAAGGPDARKLYPVYAKAAELGVPVVFTMGPNVGTVSDNHDPTAVDRVATTFPDLTIVCSHASWPRPTEMVNLAYRRPNVYLDGSIYQFFPGADPFVEAANSLVQDKVLYASAFPFSPLSDHERLANRLDDGPAEKVFHRNAERVLGLD